MLIIYKNHAYHCFVLVVGDNQTLVLVLALNNILDNHYILMSVLLDRL